MTSKQKVIQHVIDQISVDLDHGNEEPLWTLLYRMEEDDLLGYLPPEGLDLLREDDDADEYDGQPDRTTVVGDY